MLVVFVHGWGVRNPDYGSLPERFRKVFDADIADVWLSEYITFNDAVTMRDLAQAFERARRANFPDRPFACVTHSTGGPLLRLWHDRYRGPLTHLFMLAPPNHGSALAQLGKGRLSRLKSWFGGLEPGQRILDWLELGSEEAWELNKRWSTDDRLFTCVIAGATHHAAFYDHLNSYTGERCSDGVVRVASANPNYTFLQFTQNDSELRLSASQRSQPTAFLVLPGAWHTGIREPHLDEGPTRPASMLTVKVADTSGAPIEDFDLLFTAGPAYSPDALPRGFAIDRQRNQRSPNTITYFFDYAVMRDIKEFGFKIEARPDAGPVHYQPAEYRGSMFLQPDETAMVEVVLTRVLSPAVFTLSRAWMLCLRL